MGLALKCLEHVTAIGCGLAALSLGSLDPGLTALGVVSGAALLAQFKEHCAKHGLDEPELLSKMQMAVLRKWDTVDQTQADRDAVTEADTAMRLYLPDCMLSREDLAASSISKEHYPKRAARLVADQLGKKDASFAAPPSPDDQGSIQRRFAMAVVEQALKTAMDDPAYAARLMLDLVVAGNAAHAVTHERLDAVKDDTARILELVEAGALGNQIRASKIDQRAFVLLARKINLEVDDEGQALAELTDAIERLLSLEANAELGTNYETLVDQALKRMAEKAMQGDFDGAADEGSKAFAVWEARQEAERQSGIALIEGNIQQHIFRRDALAIPKWVIRRLTLENRDTSLQFKALHDEYVFWYDRGCNKGSNVDLSVSISLAWHARDIATTADERGKAQVLAGNALVALGERAVGTEPLEAAVRAYRTALTELTRKRVPLDWANTQNGLGIALSALGTCERSIDLLDKAVAAFRSSLSVFTRKRDPQGWALAMMNLGMTLGKLGQHDRDNVRLEEAVSSTRAALRVFDPERDTYYWCGSQNNLAVALQSLGEREGGTNRFDEAIEAYHAVLTIWSQEKFPLNWAGTMANLGSAMLKLAERTNDAETLEQAEKILSKAGEGASGRHNGIINICEMKLAHAAEIRERWEAGRG